MSQHQSGERGPMSRSYRVQDTIPLGPDPSINAAPPIVDDARDNGKVPGGWDNQRENWIPYRGNVPHGQALDLETVKFDGPLADGLGGTTQESLVVLPQPSAPDIEPVPVKIVDTTKPAVEKAQWRNNAIPIPAVAPGTPLAPVRAIGANPKRTKISLKVVATGTDTILIGNSEKVDPLLGWPMSNGQSHSMNITEAVWVIPAPSNTATVTLYVIEEWTQVVKPE